MRLFTLSIRSKLTLILALLTAPVALLGWFWATAAISELHDAARAREGLARIEPVWREMTRQAGVGLDDTWDATGAEALKTLRIAVEADQKAQAELDLLVDPQRPRVIRLDAGRRLIMHLGDRFGLTAQQDPETSYLARLVGDALPDLVARAQAAGGVGGERRGQPSDPSTQLQGVGGFVLLSQRIGEEGQRGLQHLPAPTRNMLVRPLAAFTSASFDFVVGARAGAMGDAEGAIGVMRGYRAMGGAVDRLWRKASERLGQRLDELHAHAVAALAISGGGLAAVLLFALIWSRALSNAILRRIAKLEHRIQLLADSDVEGEIPEREGRDEIARIAGAVECLRTRIVERMREMRDLEDAREFADAANQAKSEFLANMSHELRTPLNAIIGFSELMMLEAFGEIENERYAGYVQDIHCSAKHLLDLVNDVLDIAKIDARRCDFELCALEPEDALVDALNMLQPLIAKAQLRAAIEVAPNTPRVWADSRALHQIVLNLLSNAVKFTPEGGMVTLIAAPADLPGAEAGGVRLGVRDTGPGIAPEDLAKLGSPFERLSGAHVAKKEGAGLGLAISRSLSQALGGALQFESTVGVGTTASTVLPAYSVMFQETEASDAA